MVQKGRNKGRDEFEILGEETKIGKRNENIYLTFCM